MNNQDTRITALIQAARATRAVLRLHRGDPTNEPTKWDDWEAACDTELAAAIAAFDEGGAPQLDDAAIDAMAERDSQEILQDPVLYGKLSEPVWEQLTPKEMDSLSHGGTFTVLDDIPTFTTPGPISVIDALCLTNLASSKREARQFIQAGGVSVQYDREAGHYLLPMDHQLVETCVMQRGKLQARLIVEPALKREAVPASHFFSLKEIESQRSRTLFEPVTISTEAPKSGRGPSGIRITSEVDIAMLESRIAVLEARVKQLENDR